ncbi:hypothetical protein EVAR_37499_1 [Eumeta japonica]|uniref:Uncharacterized protein n=1 Tax=Eumeta variegata TaxID=151549 RepID=A0A4C1XB84_EUMVA|nr:hypothetical protein EVAR_37499_1 [Eumeta japonica]
MSQTPENAVEAEPSQAVEETKKALENGEEKTPETPVTEPLTNGSSTPESPKTETTQKEGSVALTPDNDAQKDAPNPESVSEPLPVNGVSPKESKDDVTITEVKSEEIKSEETSAVAPEVPASENSVQKEVCVEQMPLIEPTPPPLPASPPPSSVASFAETTMASHIEQTPLADPLTPAILPPALTAHVAATEPIGADQLTNKSSPIDSALMSKDLSEHNLAESIATDNDTVDIENEKENLTSDYAENLSSTEVTEIRNVTLSKSNDQIETNVICCPVAAVNNDNEIIDVNLNDVTSEKKTTEDYVATTNSVDEIVNLEPNKDVCHDTEKSTDKFMANEAAEPTILSDKVTDEIAECVKNPNCVISPDKTYVNTTSVDDNIEQENIINKNKKSSEENEENKAKSLIDGDYAIECNGNIEDAKQLTALPLESDVRESVNMATTPDDSVAASIAELPPPEDEPAEHRDERHDSNEGSESFPAPPSDLDSVSSATSPEPQVNTAAHVHAPARRMCCSVTGDVDRRGGSKLGAGRAPPPPAAPTAPYLLHTFPHSVVVHLELSSIVSSPASISIYVLIVSTLPRRNDRIV